MNEKANPSLRRKAVCLTLMVGGIIALLVAGVRTGKLVIHHHEGEMLLQTKQQQQQQKQHANNIRGSHTKKKELFVKEATGTSRILQEDPEPPTFFGAFAAFFRQLFGLPPIAPTDPPTPSPIAEPLGPTTSPTTSPTGTPTKSPTAAPTMTPTTSSPTASPTTSPTATPTKSPTAAPTMTPTTSSPTTSPTTSPTGTPTKSPTAAPTMTPTTSSPTTSPTKSPTGTPTKSPTAAPTRTPTKSPTKSPTTSPTKSPTGTPTQSPTPAPAADTSAPTLALCGMSAKTIVEDKCGGFSAGPFWQQYPGCQCLGNTAQDVLDDCPDFKLDLNDPDLTDNDIAVIEQCCGLAPLVDRSCDPYLIPLVN